MNDFNVARLAVALQKLMGTQFAAFYLGQHQGPLPGEAGLDDLFQTLDGLLEVLRPLGMERSATKVAGSLEYFRNPNSLRDRSAIESDARNIRETLINELSEHAFAKVEKDRLQYYNKQYLFGETVAQAFPSSAYDIAEAGNCLAVECNTAAVFHLMRVAEYGLRALAFDRRIKIPKGRPIELAAWDDILKELEKAEDEIKNYRRTLAREAQFEFHHGAMMQFKRFKNVFRNRIMHTRESFDRHQALSVLEQVREFMTILSRHIAEGKRTPKVWRGKKWAADA